MFTATIAQMPTPTPAQVIGTHGPHRAMVAIPSTADVYTHTVPSSRFIRWPPTAISTQYGTPTTTSAAADRQQPGGVVAGGRVVRLQVDEPEGHERDPAEQAQRPR